jgi:F-type H+-transporting ATPase subunit delta
MQIRLLETAQIEKTHAPSMRRKWVVTRMRSPGGAYLSGRVDVAEPASISLGIASRYAQALFEIAKEENGLKALEADTDALGAALAASPELGVMIGSPVVAREDQANAMAAIAAKMGLSAVMSNTIALMASKRRLFVLPQLIANLRARIAEEKGEVTAEVTSASAMSAAQVKALAASLKAKVGKDVKLQTSVDESLIGGLIVKLGSTMIDTSVKAKLAALQNAMKEVG